MILPYCTFCTALGWRTLNKKMCKIPSCHLQANLRRRKSEVQKCVQVFSFRTTDSSCVVINVTGKIVTPVGICVLLSLKGRHSKYVNLPYLSFEQLSQGIEEPRVLCLWIQECCSEVRVWQAEEMQDVNPYPCFVYMLYVVKKRTSEGFGLCWQHQMQDVTSASPDLWQQEAAVQPVVDLNV